MSTILLDNSISAQSMNTKIVETVENLLKIKGLHPHYSVSHILDQVHRHRLGNCVQFRKKINGQNMLGICLCDKYLFCDTYIFTYVGTYKLFDFYTEADPRKTNDESWTIYLGQLYLKVRPH